MSKERSGNFTPVSPLGQLQLIFARLQFSLKSSVDPTQFVNSLDLDVSQQQDAQEFSKLFLTLIEEDLKNQKNPEVRSIVQKQYCGDYVYITKCLNCQNESKRPSTFYELSLNIKGNRDLYECLDEFFAPEQLEGNNQYYCNNCESLQNGERYVKLQKLPPYLNLQLLRFVFDRLKGRKKLNTQIKFPESLTLDKYFDVPHKADYRLCAVLMHRGSSCFSGHYIAQIKDRTSKNWFKFNDEIVEKIDGKNLKLGSADNDRSADSDRSNKGVHSSDDAYMLVYKDVSLDDTALPPDHSEKWDIPDYLQTILLEDNSKFEESIKTYNQIKNQNLALNKEKQSEIKSVYEELIKNENVDECEWISKQWIMDWLAGDSSKPVAPIDNTKATCVHGKLAISSIDKMKFVNTNAVDLLYSKYDGGPRLRDLSSCCRECVEMKVRSIQSRHKINNDSKQITSMLKFSLPINEPAYWVGKESLKNWKQMALKKCDLYEKSLEGGEFAAGDSVEANSTENENTATGADGPASNATTGIQNNNSPLSNQSKSNSSENGDSDSENKPPASENSDKSSNDKANFNFNDDILCVHGRLSPDEANKKLVAQSVWNLLKSHFPSACEFVLESECCQECLVSVEWFEVFSLRKTGC